jgi:hypothetical protein
LGGMSCTESMSLKVTDCSIRTDQPAMMKKRAGSKVADETVPEKSPDEFPEGKV